MTAEEYKQSLLKTKTEAELYQNSLTEPEESPPMFGRKMIIPKAKAGIYKDLGRLMSGEKNIDDLIPLEEKYQFGEIVGLIDDPQAQRDKVANSLYLSVKYNVPPQAISETLNEIVAQKWDGKMSQAAIKQRLAEEHTTEVQQSLKEEFQPASLFGQAFLQSLAAKPAMMLRGLTTYTPGEALGLDGLLRKTSDYLESLRDAEVKGKIETAAAGKLWPAYEGSWYKIKPELLPETVNAWAATVGDQIPIMLATWAGRVIGKTTGKPIGAIAGGVYAMATAGPDPHDVAAAPIIAKVTEKVVEHLGGATPLVAMEAGNYLDRAEELGIDLDVAERYARKYGVYSGMIEYAQWLWNLKAFRRLSPKVKRSILKRIFLELGGGVWEGLEELSQEALQNRYIGDAIEEQKERTPDYDAEKPETWAGGKRAFGVGLGVSLLTRLPGHAFTSARQAVMTRQIQQQTSATKEEATVAVKALAEGGVVAEQAKQVIQEQVKVQQQELAKEETQVPPKQPQGVVADIPVTRMTTTEKELSKKSETVFFSPTGLETPEYGDVKIDKYISKDAKIYKKEDSTLTFAEKRGLYNKPDKDVKRITGYDTLAEVDEKLQGIDNDKYYAAFQVVAEKQLKKEGYDGAYWSEEEDLAPQQYQIWNKDVIKAPPKAAEGKVVASKAAEATPAKLRQKIGAMAAKKGLTKKALTELKKKHTGFNKLTGKVAEQKITTKQLQSLLKAVEKARPKQIGHKKVITQKTETKIQTHRDSLIKKGYMSEAGFQEILKKEVYGREPKYIDADHFITEAEGKQIIKRIIDETEVSKLVEGFNQAVENNPEITQQVEILDTKISKQSKRDPYSFESMRYYNQQAEIKTGAPMFTVYMDLIDTHLESNMTRTATLKKLQNIVGKDKFRAISASEAAQKRISDYITSQSYLKDRPAVPKDITPDEIAIANQIKEILEDYKLRARFTKFYWWWLTGKQAGPYPMADYDNNKAAINKAVDIYESKGKDALITYLKTQTWGVIRSGYEPIETLLIKVKPYTPKATAVGKGHIKIRTDIEYHSQEKTLFQRLSSYMRQMDMLYDLSPKINAYVRLFDDNMDKFNNPSVVKENIELFIRNLKRYNLQGGWFERAIARLYSQAMRTIIMPSPVLAFRNLFQNFAFEHDKTILLDLRNKPLSDKDIEYLEIYVLQQRAMIEEFFMTGEKPLPGLKNLTEIVDKIKSYPWSDTTNRHLGFWAKINQARRALESLSVSKIMEDAKFKDMTYLEQKRALSILARDGKQAMARYVSRVHVDDIHFLYERAQRSPAEMSPLGKVVGNLMLFPRAYGEKLAHQTHKLLNKQASMAERVRALKVLLAVIAGGVLIGAVYRKVTGRKRNPYNPLTILSFRPGGLAWGTIESTSEIMVNMLSAIQGDDRALAALTTAIPEAADMFIPFYDYTLRGYEALTGQKNVDRKALRQIRQLIDNEYRIRGGAYKLERNAVEKWQYFLAGSGVDEKIEAKRPKGRKAVSR